MNHTGTQSETRHSENAQKPVIAIMGEFSVGKSTLSNLLIGANPLPVKVTATQLPPVWIAYGDRDPYREDLDGNVVPVDLARLEEIPLQETAVIRIFLRADILQLCDFIDMPGISDPNMDSEVWERMLHHADGVLWCTHATQAWRQTEAAVWKSMPPALFAKSLLLITRFDKLLSTSDRKKVLKRVNRETSGLFADIFPISLTRAIAAKDNQHLWVQSGAETFTRSLINLLHEISGTVQDPAQDPFADMGGMGESVVPEPDQGAPVVAVRPSRVNISPNARKITPRPPRREGPRFFPGKPLSAGS